jgi:hypothetical protein
MELCAKQSCFADATDALAAASGAASERPISTAAQSNRSREAFNRKINLRAMKITQQEVLCFVIPSEVEEPASFAHLIYFESPPADVPRCSASEPESP